MARTLNKPNTNGNQPVRPERNGGGGFALSRAAFAKVSAVEGIFLSREMEADFREFERAGLTNEKRRRKIISKYGRSSRD